MKQLFRFEITAEIDDDINAEAGHEAIVRTKETAKDIVEALVALGLQNVKSSRRLVRTKVKVPDSAAFQEAVAGTPRPLRVAGSAAD